jgi:hypothetical protein
MTTTLRHPVLQRSLQPAAAPAVSPPVSPPATRPRLARLHLWLARAILAGIALQVFFAGLGLFSRLGFTAHALFAPALFVAGVALAIVGSLAHLNRSLVTRSWALLGLMIVQGLLIDLGRWVWLPISSLHPLNALALVFVAYTLARRSTRSSGSGRPSASQAR